MVTAFLLCGTESDTSMSFTVYLHWITDCLQWFDSDLIIRFVLYARVLVITHCRWYQMCAVIHDMCSPFRGTGAVVNAACLESRRSRVRPPSWLSIVGSLRDREVACSASDRQGSNFESCVRRTESSHPSHHPQEVLLAQFSLYVHKGGLKPDSFHFVPRPDIQSFKETKCFFPAHS